MLAGPGGEAMARHRTYSIEFKRQVAQEFLGGENRPEGDQWASLCQSSR